ncbi:MAG: sulfatase family protein [Solirubrobacterales bacterium]
MIAAAALLALVVVLGSRAAGEPASAAPRQAPNIVVIQTDDQTLAELRAVRVTPLGNRVRAMPNTLDLIRRHGISFNRYIASYPLCCPSRSTLLSGRYAHSTGVLRNSAPRGGWLAYRRQPIFRHNLAVWLHRAGYRTVHLGKFLNEYGGPGPDDPTRLVPPGWDVWQTDATDNSTRLYYGYLLNRNGTIRGPFGSTEYGAMEAKDSPDCPLIAPAGGCNYQEDQLTNRAVREIDRATPGRPFYLQLDYNAPHGDHSPPIGPEPARRHWDTAIDTPLPRPPGFNEADISDKPSFIRDDAEPLGPTDFRRMRIDYQKSLESLRSVDEGVGRVIGALRRSGELGRTYVLFTSDNGFFFGEHRLDRSKFLPYEPAIRMPLLIRGPGIRANSSTEQLVANVDLAPTIVDLAGAHADRSFDGRTLVPFWTRTALRTRRPILLESFAKATDITPGGERHGIGRRRATPSISAPIENYLGVRLDSYKYIEYETGDRELYDLRRDPYELRNVVTEGRYARVRAFLRRQLRRLEDCHGKECRFTTGRPPQPSPTP